MAEPSPHPDEFFNAARRLDDPQARKEYLDQVCAGNVELRERVEALLGAHAAAGGFLEPSAAGGDLLTVMEPEVSMRERPGTVIGPYKLLEQIGEGGMAVVFLAAQSRPLERKVALKVI